MNPRKLVKTLLQGAVDSTVVAGPAVWEPSHGISGKRWYMIVVTRRADGPYIASVTLDGYGDPDKGRAVLMATLFAHRPSCIIYDTRSELDTAQMCAALWPCERLQRLAKIVDAEPPYRPEAA